MNALLSFLVATKLKKTKGPLLNFSSLGEQLLAVPIFPSLGGSARLVLGLLMSNPLS
jgi:hypothetical protein